MAQGVAVNLAGLDKIFNQVQVKITELVLIDDIGSDRKMIKNFSTRIVRNAEAGVVLDVKSHRFLLCYLLDYKASGLLSQRVVWWEINPTKTAARRCPC